MTPLDQVLRTLKLADGSCMDELADEKIKYFVRSGQGQLAFPESKWKDGEGFDGNFHCETLSLSLHLLAIQHKSAMRKEDSQDAAKAKTKDNPPNTTHESTRSANPNPHPHLPPSDITNHFTAPSSALPVSNPCCPACHALTQYVLKNTPTPMYQETWVPATLPPWIPRLAGEAIIDATEKKLRERLRVYLARPSQHSNGGTSLWGGDGHDNVDYFTDEDEEQDE